MPRQSINDIAMTGAERQARYRAARAAGTRIVHTRRPIDRRGYARRWHDAVAELTELQRHYAAWHDALPESLRDSSVIAEALREICDLDLTDLQAINPPRGFGRD
jgi:hypothetical protein